MSGPRVVVVGAGASGTLQALHLQRAGADVTLVERAARPGRGVAYGTTRPEHLLNVPARRMSAFADEIGHFSRWWADRTDDAATEEDYAPRMVYGDYLTELLAESGVAVVHGEAVDVAGAVLLADGQGLAADAVVLAPGNFRPATPRGIDPAALGDRWIEDPWAGGLEGLGPKDVVFLLGTGLTAVDVALTLEATGFRGRIVALSRRGLAPRSHGLREPMVAAREDLVPSCTKMLRRVRQRSGEVGWRGAVHELRTVTQWLWGAADEAERRRFLRHLRPWWDVHRHKLAPAVGATIEAMRAEARLAVAAGRLVSVDPVEGGVEVRFRLRGHEEIEQLRAARIVNCTGPELGIARAGEPLLDVLLAKGAIREDALGIGVDVDLECRAIGADGAASETLSVIGPVTRGTFWESVAVPDIKVQAARVAARLTG
ncbi:MAG TPA: FAD-dependent oxidoreductase [Allosphingosinicella sp.]|nr:FAD-dependent oxidoreductase [Allosphingosinicella sp.]